MDNGNPFNLLKKKVNNTFGNPVEDRQICGLPVHFVRKLMNSMDNKCAVDKMS